MAINLRLDKGALERLLTGDDGTIKVELQQAVIAEFARHHIKEVVNSKVTRDIVQAAADDVCKQITKAMNEQVAVLREKPGRSWDKEWVLLPAVLKKIDETAAVKVREQLNEAVNAAVERRMQEIEATIQQRVDADMKFRVEMGVRARLKKIAGELES